MTSLQAIPKDKSEYILIIEDSEVDFEIISRAFRQVHFAPYVMRCEDGDSALKYFNLLGESDARIPSLVLLDLNMPGTDGREVLRCMKRDDRLKEIPIIVLSTSNNITDIEYCFKNGANKYICKPMSIEEYMSTVGTIRDFWESQILVHVSL